MKKCTTCSMEMKIVCELYIKNFVGREEREDCGEETDPAGPLART